MVTLSSRQTNSMASTERQRWAQVPPHLAWKHPGLPREWTRVLERLRMERLN